MNGQYGRAIAKARSEARPMRDDLGRHTSLVVEASKRPSGTHSSLRFTPRLGTFRCGDALGLLVYDYFTRAVSRVQGQQEEFKFEVDRHMCKQEPSCGKCAYILDLIRWYFDCWWRGEGLSAGDRATSLDSACVTVEDLELIASVIEGWAMAGLRVNRR